MAETKNITDLKAADAIKVAKNASEEQKAAWLAQELARPEKDQRSTVKEALQPSGNGDDDDTEITNATDPGAPPADNAGEPGPDQSAEGLKEGGAVSAADGSMPLEGAVNAAEVAALQGPRAGRAEVDLTTTPQPALEASRLAAARANAAAEGPISGSGAHRLAAPAPAGVPGEAAEMHHPARHDARRTDPRIARPAPTSGPEVESPAGS